MPLSPKPPVGRSGSVTRLIEWAVPSGPNVTHGSDARWNGPPVHLVSVGTATCVHVAPPLK